MTNPRAPTGENMQERGKEVEKRRLRGRSVSVPHGFYPGSRPHKDCLGIICMKYWYF